MTLRVGAGSGGAPDRVAPALELARQGNLDYLCFEALAERTLAQGHARKLSGTGAGYNPLLRARLKAVLPLCADSGTKIITNMGAADPLAAGEVAAGIARDLGLDKFRIAVLTGDDVSSLVGKGTYLPEARRTIGEFGASMINATAYLGAEGIVDALRQGADLVITGRVADPSLFVAPMIHHFGWAYDDWRRLGQGTLVGHLLECSTQVTGGYFADPGKKTVPDIDNLGYPIAEIAENGTSIITKLQSAGGCVTPLTVKEQLLYEVHDPRAYLTPDVSADFSSASIREVGENRVRVSEAGGRARPDQLKVLVGFDGGYLAEAEISYAGINAQERALLAEQIVRKRMTDRLGFTGDLRIDLIGVNAILGTAERRHTDTLDVRLRAAVRTMDRNWAECLLAEVEGLWMAGPAGGGGYRGTITPSVLTQATFIDRTLVQPSVHMVEI